MTKSEEIAARAAKYNRIEKEADAFGRLIGVKQLRPAERIKIEEWSPNLDGFSTETDPGTGFEYKVPRRLRLFVAGSVCEIDGNLNTFPKSRAELDAIMNVLDDEGFHAALKAMSRFAPAKDEGEGDAKKTADDADKAFKDELKND